MAVARGPFLAAVLLLVSSGLHCASPLPACPEPCTCQRAPLLNCSSSGLSLVPQQIQDSVAELDLSHNLLDSVTLDRPHHNLRNVWLGNNSITRLSLCIERNLGGRYVRGRQLHHLRPWSRGGCVSWAPTLQLLSVERNQLEQLPEGLEGSELLQVLQLSFNRISTLRPGDLSHLRQLKELHLQHNLITSLHPQMFQDLAQLRVLDLSFNMLTSLHPLMYLSLRNIGADIRLDGNRWQCDCSMRNVRRRMAYDSSKGLQAWSLVCASPSILSGRDLLLLEEEDLNCFSTENQLYQDVTVYSGSEILLSCSTQDSIWWTPSGQASMSQPKAGLLINDITERDTGLYVCVSEEHEVVSVFNLQISKIVGARRKTRSLPRSSRQIIPQGTANRIGQEKNQRAVQQSDLNLAVCLSVFITFLIAFILGVLARPCIDIIWRRVTNKRRSPETNSVPSVEQGQYDNEAYSNVDESGTHRERRVTFSNGDRENSNVQYYDTVASGEQENIYDRTMIEREVAEAEDTHTAGDSGSENSLRQSNSEENQKDDRDLPGITDAGHTHNMDFEHIPDPVELKKRRSLSSSSDSSLSDKVFNEDLMNQRYQTKPKSPRLAEDSVQQKADSLTTRKVVVPQISIEGTGIPEFSSEPFASWSPLTKNPNLTGPDPWQENGEQFEYSDSVRSMSPRSSSVFGSFNDSKLIVAPASNKQKRDVLSSSSSSISEDEPTGYTVNQEEADIERNHNRPEVSNVHFQQQIHGVNHAMRPKHSFSSHSSDSGGEDYTVKQKTDKGEGKGKSIGVSDKLSRRIGTGESDTRKKVEPMPRTKFRVPTLGVTSHSKSLDTRAPSTPAAYSSSSSSESEEEFTDLKAKQNTGRVKEGIKINEPKSIPKNKRNLYVNAALPASNSTSSDESTDDTTKHTKKQGQADMDMAGLPITKYKSVSHDAMKPQRSSIDFGHVTPSKRRLDIKASSPPTDSSSNSDSADETMDEKQKQGETHSTRLQFQESPTRNHDPQTQGPVLDLGHTRHVKSGLDIKAPSPASDSSSSSDSEDETTHHTDRSWKVDIAKPASQKSQASHAPDTRWPALDLEHIPHVKSRLDIKAPSPDSDSSSSSESEDETTGHVRKQEKGETHMARFPIKVSQTVSHDPRTQRPVLDLGHTKHVKSGLDIKAPSPDSDSSSSSDSEDETTSHIEKKRPSKVDITGLPFQKPQTASHDPGTRWPALDLEHIPRIKRRLDIKAPSHDSDSSSSSGSEDETTDHLRKQEKGETHMARFPIKVSQTVNHEPQTQRPVLDLGHTTHVKSGLDIKAPSSASDSSSSSDSEDERAHQADKPGKMHIGAVAFQKSQKASHNPDTRWPALDLEQNMHIKRRLDIKASSPASDSSSSSDSEDETTSHIEKQRPGKVDTAGFPFQESQTQSQDPDTRWPALDLRHIPRIKRRLDIKAPSHDSDSSSSSDSEDETTGHRRKQEKGETHMARFPSKVSQTVSHEPQTQRPLLDLGHTTHVKSGLDIKAPSSGSDSSSSSDSEDERAQQADKPKKMHIGAVAFQKSQKASHSPDTRWPALDLEQNMHIKRRLDIKASSPASDSSSSSDSEDETMQYTGKPQKVNIAKLASQKSQKASHNPDTRWPALDLEHIPHVKRRLDIKAPSPDSDSSSSSDSEDETTSHIEKQRPGMVDITGLPFQKSQTASHDPDTRWPALDLEHIPHVKSRLDIKAPSPASDSSSSSNSEDETTGHLRKQEKGETHMARFPSKVSQTVSHEPQTQRPLLDLGHTTHVKSGLDIKAPSSASDSSSSSDSEDERAHQADKPKKMHIGAIASQKSQTASHNPDTRWPVLDLEQNMHIKRRLDIKASSQASDSSSSSESEDETMQYTGNPQKVDIAKLASQKSQKASHNPDTRWPALDLEHIPHIKSRLDIKAPSPASDSSSSSNSEDETTGHLRKQEKGERHMARFPSKVSQTVSHEPQTQRPLLDLGHTTHVKSGLDIKAPSSASDSSSSSDSEDERAHQADKPKKMHIGAIASQKSQTASHNPDTRWPVLDLEQNMHIKRRLDIKASSQASDSSSSSDSEDETMQYTGNPQKVDIAKLASQKSQKASHNPDTRWPALDLEHIPHIKRRLDIKAPSPDSDSSSSSDSEDETTSHIEKQRPGKVDTAGFPFQESQTQSQDPDTRWPALDLRHIPRIKRRLDIKAPSHDSVSSSSSDSEDETTGHLRKQEKGETHMARFPSKVSQTVSHEPQTQRSIQDTYIKRGLDIKAPSPASDSSSSSDSEDETTHHKEKEKPELVVIAGVPFKWKSPTVIHSPETGWPAVDLGNITRIKRRLDLKAPPPPPPPDSLLSGGSRKQTVEGNREEAIKIRHYSSSSSDEQDLSNPPTVEQDPDSTWPQLGLSSASSVKRHLDIRAHSPPPESSVVGNTSYQLGTRLHVLDMSIPLVKRRLDIKAPLQQVDSSSSNSDNESRLSSHTGKHERDKDDVGITNDEQQTKLHKLSLGVPSIKRRLDIKAPSPQPDQILISVSPGSRQSESNSSSSNSEDENRDHAMVGLGASAISKAKKKESIRSPKTPVIHTSRSPKTDDNIKLEKYTISTGDREDKTTSDNINTPPEINPELKSRWATMNLNISRFRKRLEITSHTREPPNLPSSPPPDSPSSLSSEKWTGSKSSRTRQNRRGVGMQGIIHTDASPTPEEVKESLIKDYNFPKTEENADSMLTGFGTQHLRGYDVKVSEKAPATPPVQGLSDSSSSSENEDASTEHAGKGWWGRSQLPIVTDKEASQIHTSLYVPPAVNIKLDKSQNQTEEMEKKAGVELKSQTSKVGEEPDSVQSRLSLNNIPHIRGGLDIRAPLQREESSSSNSENETIDHQGPSNSSSSCSENENEVTGYTEKQSRPDSLITYKRLIFKASSPEEEPSHSVGGSNASLAPKTIPSMSLDKVVRKRIEQSRHTTDVELPPEIRWTGIGRQLSDRSISSPRGHLDVGLLTPQQAPPAELLPLDSSNYSSVKSDEKIKQDRGKPMHKYSSLSANSVSLASSRALDEFDNSLGTNEILRAVPMDSRERKGLRALKAMSSERQKWDTQADNLDMGASPLFGDHRPKVDTSFNYQRSEEDIKPVAKQPSLSYDFPHYRRHDIGGIKRPQVPPPPIPATPPPDDAVGLKWRSPQSSMKQGLDATRSYLQQSRNTEEYDPSSTASQNLSEYSDSSNPNISFV